MTDIRARLADGLKGHALRLGALYGYRLVLLSEDHRHQVADVLMSLPDIAIVDRGELAQDMLHRFKFSPQHISDLIDALREAHRIAMRPEPSEKDEAAK